MWRPDDSPILLHLEISTVRKVRTAVIGFTRRLAASLDFPLLALPEPGWSLSGPTICNAQPTVVTQKLDYLQKRFFALVKWPFLILSALHFLVWYTAVHGKMSVGCLLWYGKMGMSGLPCLINRP